MSKRGAIVPNYSYANTRKFKDPAPEIQYNSVTFSQKEYLTSSIPTPQQNVSIDVWFMCNTLPSSGEKFAVVEIAGPPRITLFVDETGYIVLHESGNVFGTSTSQIVLNEWYHATIVPQYPTILLFVNGTIELNDLGAFRILTSLRMEGDAKLTVNDNTFATQLVNNTTYSMWVKPDSDAGDFTFVDINDATYPRKATFRNDGKLVWNKHTSEFIYDIGWKSDTIADKWQHWVLVHGAKYDEIYVYLDGVQIVNEAGISGFNNGLVPSVVTFMENFKGFIHEYIVFNVILTQSDVQELYDSGNPIDARTHTIAGSNVIAYYNFSDTLVNGTVLTDSSTSGYTSTIAGTFNIAKDIPNGLTLDVSSGSNLTVGAARTPEYDYMNEFVGPNDGTTISVNTLGHGIATSADGTWIVSGSTAGGKSVVFKRVRGTYRPTQILDESARVTNGPRKQSISADGTWIVLSGDTSSDAVVYTRDSMDRYVEIQIIDETVVSHVSSFTSHACEISGDGNWIVLFSVASNVDAQGHILKRTGRTFALSHSIVLDGVLDPAANQCSINFDGTYVLFGNTEADGVNINEGTVIPLDRSGDTWTQRTPLTSPAPAINDRFGNAIRMSSDGMYAVIAGRLGGAVHFYSRSGSTWSFQQTFGFGATPTVAVEGDAVDINSDGSVAVVSDTGAFPPTVYILNRSEDGWVIRGTLPEPRQNDLSGFGHGLSLSEDGKYILVGAPNANGEKPNGGNFTENGALYLYDQDEPVSRLDGKVSHLAYFNSTLDSESVTTIHTRGTASNIYDTMSSVASLWKFEANLKDSRNKFDLAFHSLGNANPSYSTDTQ